jgi:hypothetical protein
MSEEQVTEAMRLAEQLASCVGAGGRCGDVDEDEARAELREFFAANLRASPPEGGAPAAASEAVGWQPIETAPKDVNATILMGYAPDEEGFSPRTSEGFWSQAEQRWVKTSDPGWKTSPQPTHWQELPPAPLSGATHV